MRILEQLKFIYKGAKTKRFHTADTLTEQSVGEHSFGVAWLIVLIDPNARRELILAAMAHDLAEHVIGDVSSPAKRQYPALKAALDAAEGNILAEMGLDFEAKLTTEERKLLKVADMLDGMMFCVRERRMGSKVPCKIYDNFYRYVKEIEGVSYETQDLVNSVNNMWEKYNASK